MLESETLKQTLQEKLGIPEFKIENKENIHLLYALRLAGFSKLKFSITDKDGNEKYKKFMPVEIE